LNKLEHFCAEIGLETFRPKSVEISLMAIFLQSNCIENCQNQDFGKWWNSYNYEQIALNLLNIDYEHDLIHLRFRVMELHIRPVYYKSW